MVHWIDNVVDDLLKKGKKHVVASGTSISGPIHIGNACDIFIASAVAKALKEKDGLAELVWVADDLDPLRRIPHPVPATYKKYLGMPYINIPCPEDCCSSFAEHFEKPFLESLKEFRIHPIIYFGSDLYKAKLIPAVKAALEQAGEIRAILNRYRDEALPEDWLPYSPICANCGKIATTYAYSHIENIVRYECRDVSYTKGCGYRGETHISDGKGKLAWRVEWPARWHCLQVTCEPFGKDHAVVGGSYDVGSDIIAKVFGSSPPYPVPYEWITLDGQAMSKSKGIFFTPEQWLAIAPPETLNYFIFRSKPMKQKDFSPEQLPDLLDQYDRLERVYFGEETVSEAKIPQYKRIYELSQVDKPPEKLPVQLPYTHAAILTQVLPNFSREKITTALRHSQITQEEPSPSNLNRIKHRLSLAKNWVEEYAPENMRFQVLKKLPPKIKEKLTSKQKQGLKKLSGSLKQKEWIAVELHNEIYRIAREEIHMDPPQLFQAIYLVLTGKKYGPRLGTFMLSLNTDFLIDRFQTAAK